MEVKISNSEPLLVIPLGGVEEIGLNMTVFQYSDDLIVVDAGLMFPEEDMLGVDFVIPDFSYILENREKVKGIILTHGHEDHTGALPFLIKELNSINPMNPVPVYGTLLTLALVKEKLKEYNLFNVRLIPVRPRDSITLGVFTIEFIRVTHSIVDGVGLGISTPLGNIVHTGDFKLDPTPVDGELMDFHKFTEYGEKGTLLMLSDSTNAEKGGFTFSEKEVRRAFEDIFFKASGRIIIATFASNIHRIQQAIDVAVQHGRKIVMCGRSMVANAQIALDLGYLKMPENTWIQIENLKNIPDSEVVIITTGSQGEPMSVLSRIATGDHKHINIKDGEYRHLKCHARLAEKSGVYPDNIFLMENGMVLEITETGAAMNGKISSGRVFIDGKGAAGVEDIVIRDRRRLAHDGIVIVLVGIEKVSKKIVSGPEIISRGFVFEDASHDIINEVRELMANTLISHEDHIISDVSFVQAKLRSTLKKYLRNKMDRKPMILPVVIEV